MAGGEEVYDWRWKDAVVAAAGLLLLYFAYWLGFGVNVLMPVAVVGGLGLVWYFYGLDQFSGLMSGNNEKSLPSGTEAIEKINEELRESRYYFPISRVEQEYLNYQSEWYDLNGKEKYIIGVSGVGDKKDDDIYWNTVVIWNWTDNHLIDFYAEKSSERERKQPLKSRQKLLRTSGYKSRWGRGEDQRQSGGVYIEPSKRPQNQGQSKEKGGE